MWTVKKYEGEEAVSPDKLAEMLKIGGIKKIKINFGEYDIKFLRRLVKYELTIFVETMDDVLKLLTIKDVKINFGAMVVSPYSILELSSKERINKERLFELIKKYRFDLKKLVDVTNVRSVGRIEKFDDVIDRRIINYYLYFSPHTYPKERKFINLNL